MLTMVLALFFLSAGFFQLFPSLAVVTAVCEFCPSFPDACFAAAAQIVLDETPRCDDECRPRDARQRDRLAEAVRVKKKKNHEHLPTNQSRIALNNIITIYDDCSYV